MNVINGFRVISISLNLTVSAQRQSWLPSNYLKYYLRTNRAGSGKARMGHV
jgi:hypothetical protein